MSTNTPQNKQVIKAFKKRKLLFNILWYGACLLVVVGLISLRRAGTYTTLPENVEPWVFIGASLPLFVGAIYTFRCPVCKHFFGVNTRVASCRKCQTVFVPGGDFRQVF